MDVRLLFDNLILGRVSNLDRGSRTADIPVQLRRLFA